MSNNPLLTRIHDRVSILLCLLLGYLGGQKIATAQTSFVYVHPTDYFSYSATNNSPAIYMANGASNSGQPGILLNSINNSTYDSSGMGGGEITGSDGTRESLNLNESTHQYNAEGQSMAALLSIMDNVGSAGMDFTQPFWDTTAEFGPLQIKYQDVGDSSLQDQIYTLQADLGIAHKMGYTNSLYSPFKGGPGTNFLTGTALPVTGTILSDANTAAHYLSGEFLVPIPPPTVSGISPPDYIEWPGVSGGAAMTPTLWYVPVGYPGATEISTIYDAVLAFMGVWWVFWRMVSYIKSIG